MERVPQRVLNWLHSILTAEYVDVNRTFGDVARVLESYSTLRPSTAVYTFENGSSALLLRLAGTLPVLFRGGRYSFPISIWIPKAFPTEAPLAFVAPTQEMAIRSGQHVSAEGRIYHPWLANWQPQYPLLDLLKVLEDIFSREPPVVAKTTDTPQSMPQQGSVMPPPRPPLPTEMARNGMQGSSNRIPPVLPPKPYERPSPAVTAQPPVPPRPSTQHHSPTFLPQNYSSQAQSQAQRQITSSTPYQPHAVNQQSYPNYTNQQQQQQLRSPQSQHSPVQARPPANVPVQRNDAQAVPGRQQQQQPPLWIQTAYPGSTQSYPVQTHTPIQSQQVASQPPKPQALDLLTSPFEPPLPLANDNLPAPPIPPNPEKDALLSTISQSLTTQLQSVVAANGAAIQPLSAQHAAMTHALHNLQQERGALLQLQSLLNSNEQILHQAMHDADECIASAQHKAVPGVDEVLFAPTVVGQQLYDLIAEEKASVETRDVLARALDRGRISSELWVKTVRSLAREEFLKKVLIRRCAEGMALQ